MTLKKMTELLVLATTTPLVVAVSRFQVWMIKIKKMKGGALDLGMMTTNQVTVSHFQDL